MKNDGNGLFTELRTLEAHVVLAWTIERTDGVVLGFTAGDEEFEYLGTTFKPSNAFMGMNAASKSGMAVSNTSAQALFSLDVTEEDILRGLYTDALVKMFWIDPTDTSKGFLPLQGGRMGEIKLSNGDFETELRSHAQKLQQPFGDVYTVDCRANLGDGLCKYQLSPVTRQKNTSYSAKVAGDASIGRVVRPTTPTGFWYVCVQAGVTANVDPEPAWPTSLGGQVTDGSVIWRAIEPGWVEGSVTHSYNRAIFSDIYREEPVFRFNNGKLTWLTGDNAGASMEVRSFSGDPRTFYMLEEFPFTIKIGDTYRVTRGCVKTRKACKDEFDNIFNMRGFPFMPTEDKALATPNYSSQGEQKEEEEGGIS